jgi:putative phage-type endonuclease
MHSMDQRSAEWFACRAGKVTASRIADVMARTKSGWGASRENYKAQLVIERLTGTVEPSYTNAAMQWGIDKEPEAREAYERHALVAVKEIGFVDHPTIPLAGASPDGLVGDVGMLEVKCPVQATHLSTLNGGGFADKYVKQALWQMACAEREWVDLMSFDPRWPDHLQMFVQRIERDDAAIKEIEDAVRQFQDEIEETVANLRARYERQKEAA